MKVKKIVNKQAYADSNCTKWFKHRIQRTYNHQYVNPSSSQTVILQRVHIDFPWKPILWADRDIKTMPAKME